MYFVWTYVPSVFTQLTFLFLNIFFPGLNTGENLSEWGSLSVEANMTRLQILCLFLSLVEAEEWAKKL